MKVYLDTSSLVKLYVDEPGSDDVAFLADQATTLVTSIVAYAEACAAFGRLRRMRAVTATAAVDLAKRLDADWPRFLTIAVSDDLARRAGALADQFGLRGFDAIHLASFELVLERADEGDDVHFSCADETLTKAAKKLGQAVNS